MDINKFKDMVSKERKKVMPKPFDLVYKNFLDLKLDEYNENYFTEYASDIVLQLRKENWTNYTKLEKDFSKKIYRSLVNENQLEGYTKIESINWFTSKFTDHIYAFSLSNTQSRRSRAGKEFESIIELLLMGAGITFDTQGTIGSGVFETNELAKLVDCVVPGATEYKINKRDTSLISAKTTLRERWQEVGEEMSRTMAREMYLATLDEGISDTTISHLTKRNVLLVTTRQNKLDNYKNNNYVLDFENMIEELKTKQLVWNNKIYSDNERKEKISKFKKQLDKYKGEAFLENYYKERINTFK